MRPVRPVIETESATRDDASSGAAPEPVRRRISLPHFVIVPAAAMAGLIALFRWIDHILAPEVAGGDLYQIVRTVIIASVMVSVIAWLVIRHRSAYEDQLRKRSDDLEATRDYLSNVIETSAEAIITLDVEGRVTSWNRAAREIFGWSAAEMVGNRLDRLFPPGPEYEKEKLRSVEELPAGRTLRHYETTRLRKDGSEVSVHVSHYPLFDPAHRFVGSTVMSHDVTEIKELEMRLREQERLAALGQLAAAVAHEVKNPLAGIRGACDILARGYDESDRRYELGREVLRQVDRLVQTVRNLLVFARPRAKKPVPTDIHLVLERVLGLIGEDPQSRNVDVVRRYDEDLPLLEVDPQQAEEVFFNLFVNAYQAMEYEGTITVTTERDGTTARIRVLDTGHGIPADKAHKVFEPFFTTRAKGTGLGLAIVKNIVRAHGGEVTAGSPPDGGTEFTITFSTSPEVR
jgi:PAS domain S-box-containing protein